MNKPKTLNSRKERQQGNTMLEFALVVGVLVPLLLGTFQIGMSLSRAVQVGTVNRDAGSMFVLNIDFSNTQNQQMIVRISQGLGMTLSGTDGNGVVILSQVMYVGDNECIGGGFAANSGSCPNYQQYVFIKRIVIGNASLRSSTWGTPPAADINSDGSIASNKFLTDTGCRAVGFGSNLTMTGGEISYVSETYFRSPDYDLPGFATGTGVYAQNFF